MPNLTFPQSFPRKFLYKTWHTYVRGIRKAIILFENILTIPCPSHTTWISHLPRFLGVCIKGRSDQLLCLLKSSKNMNSENHMYFCWKLHGSVNHCGQRRLSVVKWNWPNWRFESIFRNRVNFRSRGDVDKKNPLCVNRESVSDDIQQHLEPR